MASQDDFKRHFVLGSRYGMKEVMNVIRTGWNQIKAKANITGAFYISSKNLQLSYELTKIAAVDDLVDEPEVPIVITASDFIDIERRRRALRGDLSHRVNVMDLVRLLADLKQERINLEIIPDSSSVTSSPQSRLYTRDHSCVYLGDDDADRELFDDNSNSRV